MKGRLHAAHRKGRCGKDAPQTTEPAPEERGTQLPLSHFVTVPPGKLHWQEFHTFKPRATQR